MPSKRMVPEQGEAELTDQVVRLTYVCENLRDAHSKAIAEIAALTEQLGAARRERDAHAFWNKHHREQRDRALEAVEMAQRATAALNVALARAHARDQDRGD